MHRSHRRATAAAVHDAARRLGRRERREHSALGEEHRGHALRFEEVAHRGLAVLTRHVARLAEQHGVLGRADVQLIAEGVLHDVADGVPVLHDALHDRVRHLHPIAAVP